MFPYYPYVIIYYSENAIAANLPNNGTLVESVEFITNLILNALNGDKFSI